MNLFENDWVDCAAKAVLITGGIFIFIAGCVVLFETPTNAPRNSSNATQIERHEFKDDGVVCYTYGKTINHSNQISCVYVGDSNAEKQGG